MLQDLNDLAERHRKFIISLYPGDNWVKRNIRYTTKRIKHLVDIKRYPDITGRKIIEYRLKPSGKRLVEYFMRFAGMEQKPTSGIALEKREWLKLEDHNFSQQEMIDAFIQLGERGGVNVEIYDDWCNNRKRIIVQDIERAILTISTEIEWETNKNKACILVHDFSEAFAWLWIEFFDKLRKEMRLIPFQQEFIVWSKNS